MNNKKQTKIKGLKMPAYGKFMENHTMNENAMYKMLKNALINI